MRDAFQRLVARMRPVLAGQKPEVISAALADLLATLLASHTARDDAGIIDADATDQLRENLLREHMAFVRELVQINAAMLHGDDAS